MRKKQPCKPVGISGPTLISNGPNGAKAEFIKLQFPNTKEEIEHFIVKGFLRTAQQSGLLSSQGITIGQNKQDDFDFHLNWTDSTTKGLELMEVAPLEQICGSYESASESYKPYELADYIFNKILGKSSRYQTSVGDGLFLLIYITDLKFVLCNTVIALLQYWSVHNKHCFEKIYCYFPIMQDDGIVQLIYPTPPEYWESFNPDKYRENLTTNLNPNGWSVS